ncbi:MAG: hypothetical protein JW757_13920 [Anaerolineales bacterium]|nr:hypothetical protein [Anaerolineales bacterium]
METTAKTEQPFVGIEKVETPMMVYTAQGLIWGNLYHSSMIQPSRILLGVTIPEYLPLEQAQVIFMEPNYVAKPIKHRQILIPTSTILGYHLMPPHKDVLDYDPTEPNRVMAPLTFYTGAIKIQGNIRISEVTDAKTTLEVMKAAYLTMYQVEISHLTNTQMAPIRAGQAYFRVNSLLIAL